LAARDQVASRLRNQLKEEQAKISKLEETVTQSREKESQTQIIHSKEMEAQAKLVEISEGKFTNKY